MWIGTNAYTWHLVSEAEGKTLDDNLPSCLDRIAESGLKGYEPGVGSPEDLEKILKLCKERDLTVKSIYFGDVMHEEAEAQKTAETMLAVGEVCKANGISVMVNNPVPINWGTDEEKSEAQLRLQLEAFENVGFQLNDMGVDLAYHFHTPEFRSGGREAYIMMNMTSPDAVKLCLDTHWGYRAIGNSQLGLESLIKGYGSRIVSLHLRQSHNEIWADGFGPGDIDYETIIPMIKEVAPEAIPVMEICWEDGSVRERDPVELHAEAAAYYTKIWENA